MQALRYLALGDSYTIGENVPETERWPVQLAARLSAQGWPVDDPQIVARTGWTTAELQQGIAQAEVQGTFDLVSLLIGVNNQYRGASQDVYRQEFRELLALAVQFAGGASGRVFVLSIPDWGVTPFARGRDQLKIAAEIDAFNLINREEALAAGIAYVDVTAVSRQASSNPAWIAGDGLHPSGQMYTAWVDLALPVVSGILESTGSQEP